MILYMCTSFFVLLSCIADETGANGCACVGGKTWNVYVIDSVWHTNVLLPCSCVAMATSVYV